MQSRFEIIMNRREFLRGSVLGAASIAVARLALAQDMSKTPLQELEEVFRLNSGIGSIKEKDWKPLDVTDIVNKAVGGREWEFQKTRNRDGHYNEKWTVQSFFRVGDDKIHLPKKYGTQFLCQAQPRKVYTLDLGDDMDKRKVVFPLFTGGGSFTTSIADNGVVVYRLETTEHGKLHDIPGRPYPEFLPARTVWSENPEKIVLANICTGKKLTFMEKPDPGQVSSRLYTQFELSGTGNRLLHTKYGFYAVLDTSNYSIVDTQSRHRAYLISHDGRFIVDNYSWDGGYFLRNIDTKEEKLLTDETSRRLWVMSANSDFVSCYTNFYHSNFVEVIAIKDDELFRISGISSVKRIDNDGTIHTPDGTLKYQNRRYQWATEGKPQPKDLKILNQVKF